MGQKAKDRLQVLALMAAILITSASALFAILQHRQNNGLRSQLHHAQRRLHDEQQRSARQRHRIKGLENQIITFERTHHLRITIRTGGSSTHQHRSHTHHQHVSHAPTHHNPGAPTRHHHGHPVSTPRPITPKPTPPTASTPPSSTTPTPHPVVGPIHSGSAIHQVTTIVHKVVGTVQQTTNSATSTVDHTVGSTVHAVGSAVNSATNTIDSTAQKATGTVCSAVSPLVKC